MKKYLCTILLLVLIAHFIFLTGCGENIKYVPKVPDEVENFKAVEASHMVSYDDVDCYVVIKNKLQKDDLLYSITLYMNFQKGERTNRLYSYYQFDYYLENGTFLYDYHLFDSIDGAYRNYSQNFMPYYNLGHKIQNFNFLVKYSYDMKNPETNKKESFEKEYSFSENIISFDDTKDYIFSEDNKYIVEVNTETSKKEKFMRYKLNVLVNDNTEGHIDMQAFAVTSSNTIYPLYGIYHYDLHNGNYYSVSDEKIDSDKTIEKVYVIVNEYDYDNNHNTYYLEAKLE